MRSRWGTGLWGMAALSLVACGEAPALIDGSSAERPLDAGPLEDAASRDADPVDGAPGNPSDAASQDAPSTDGARDASVSDDGRSEPVDTRAGAWEAPPRAGLIPAAERFPNSAFTLGGQSAFFHDEGHRGGVFHTYDAFDACGPARRIHVFLPRDYAERSDRLPTLYFNDGNTTFWPGGVSPDAWEAAEAQSDLFAAGRVGRAIFIAIHPLDREREYTHVDWLAGRSCCGAAEYTERVATCMAPWIDDHYRSDPSRRAIVGSSHGGLAAFYAATRHPEVFTFAAALSPSFWAGVDSRADGTRGDGSLAESALVAPVLTLLGDASRRPGFWIDWGLVRTGGVHNAVIESMATDRGREMVTLLESRGYGPEELTWLEDPSGAHDEASWARRFPQVLERILTR